MTYDDSMRQINAIAEGAKSIPFAAGGEFRTRLMKIAEISETALETAKQNAKISVDTATPVVPATVPLNRIVMIDKPTGVTLFDNISVNTDDLWFGIHEYLRQHYHPEYLTLLRCINVLLPYPEFCLRLCRILNLRVTHSHITRTEIPVAVWDGLGE